LDAEVDMLAAFIIGFALGAVVVVAYLWSDLAYCRKHRKQCAKKMKIAYEEAAADKRQLGVMQRLSEDLARENQELRHAGFLKQQKNLMEEHG
jgi:hypothetical protein